MKDYEKYGIPNDLFLDNSNIDKYREYATIIEINSEVDIIFFIGTADLSDSSRALWFAADYWTTLEASLLIAGLNPQDSNLYAIAEKTPHGWRDGLIKDVEYFWINKVRFIAAKDYFFIFERSPFNPQAAPSKWLNLYLERILGKSIQHECIDDYGKEWLKILNITSSELNALEAVNKPESTRKTENLLRTLVAVAIDGYGYRPDDKKSPIPQQISEALNKVGVELDSKTIRNYLKEGINCKKTRGYLQRG